jgi:hypothetical protein
LHWKGTDFFATLLHVSFEDNKQKNGRLYNENTKLWVMCMGSLSRHVGELQGVVEELKSKACAKEVDLNLTAQFVAVEEGMKTPNWTN